MDKVVGRAEPRVCCVKHMRGLPLTAVVGDARCDDKWYRCHKKFSTSLGLQCVMKLAKIGKLRCSAEATIIIQKKKSPRASTLL